jgi:hypothetical protein
VVGQLHFAIGIEGHGTIARGHSTSSVTSSAVAPTSAWPAPAPAGLDALSLIGPVVLKRVGPGAAALAAGVALGWALRGRRERRRHWTRRLGLR